MFLYEASVLHLVEESSPKPGIVQWSRASISETKQQDATKGRYFSQIGDISLELTKRPNKGL